VARRPTPTRRARTRTVLTGRYEQVRAERAAAGYPVTWRQLAEELGVSESSLYKQRAGTRSGVRVFERLREAGARRDVYQAVVQTTDARGHTMTQSVNVQVDPAQLRAAGVRSRTLAGPRLAGRPEAREAVRAEVGRRQARYRRQKRGSRPWTRLQVEASTIVEFRQVRRPEAEPVVVQLEVGSGG
jgi:hypothetical protein